MSIHEHLPPLARKELKEIGRTKARELAKLARRDGQHFNCAPWVHKAREMPRENFRREVEKDLTGKEEEPSEVLERDGWRCQACGSMQKLEVHHLQFRSRLGADDEMNLITLCGDCHRCSLTALAP